jgi:hypothetical protein
MKRFRRIGAPAAAAKRSQLLRSAERNATTDMQKR